MIGLNRFKDFLLLIIIMKSSEFLTKLFIRGVTTFSLNLKMARLQGHLHSFYLLLFFSPITLCYFYFLVKNDFNPFQTGLCFASCRLPIISNIPSEIAGLLRLHVNAGYFLPRLGSLPDLPSGFILPLHKQLLNVFKSYSFTTSCELGVIFSVIISKYLMVPEVLLFSSCHSKNFEPLSGDNNVAHKLNKERKDRRRPQRL